MTTLITFNKKKKVGVVYFAKRKILRKFSFDKKKYKLIKNEFQGQGWYQSRQKIIFNTPRFITKKSKDYIDLPIILGNKKNFWNTLQYFLVVHSSYRRFFYLGYSIHN